MTNELQHLVKMINQIAENQPKHLETQEASKNVAEHINKFWAKPMRQKLLQQKQDILKSLSPIAQNALLSIHA